MKYKPYPYQEHLTEHIIEVDIPGLFVEMGLGKTVAACTGVDILMNDMLEVSKCLVIAPKRVADSVWTAERDKWDHLKHLKISKVLGSEIQRIQALKADANIYVINRENVVWLVARYGRRWPFDMVVVDESSSFKSHKSARFKALKSIRPFVKRVVILTGTPAPNNLLDLWSQVYLLDKGQRLGDKFGGYRERYFKPTVRSGPIVHKYAPKMDIDVVYKKISDICISMKQEDYLQLPEKIIQDVHVNLSKPVREKYEKFEEELVLEIIDDETVNAVNAAVLSNKLRQFTNGAVYGEDKQIYELHNEKMDALEELIEAAQGNPVLVFYSFKHDLERIMKRFKNLNPRQLKSNKDIDDWNKGLIQLMVAHPASAGHGLNLQAGGHVMIWYGLDWSLELYEQAIARLHRQGQMKPVTIFRLICPGTIDVEVAKSLSLKAIGQNALMHAVKAIIKKHAKRRIKS